MKRSALVIVIVLALLGVADAVLLTINKVQDQVAGQSQSTVCQIVSAQGCQIAFDSAMADLGPIPLSLLAAVTYLMIIVVSVIMWRGMVIEFGGAALFLISLGAVLYSVVLAGYSWSQSSWCMYCIGLYVINIGLLVATTSIYGKGLIGGVRSAFSDLFRLRRQFSVAAIMFTVALFSSYGAYSVGVSQAMKGYTELAHKLIDRSLKAGRFPMPVEGAPAMGSTEAKYTVLKFSDFQCPHCKRLWDALEQLHERRPEEIQVVFRHYPLSSKCNPLIAVDAHPRACDAASAAVCAQKQGRFHEMAGKMFENQTNLESEHLENYAKASGINIDEFRTCMSDKETMNAVRNDVLLATSLGVEGTPTSLVNGLRFVGGLPYSLWQLVLNGLEEQSIVPADVPINKSVERVRAALERKSESIANSDIQLTLRKKNDDRPAIVSFIDPETEAGNKVLRALSEFANRRSHLARVSVYVVSKSPSAITRRIVCAHLANRRDLLIAQGASNLSKNKGVQAAFKDLDECVAGEQPVSTLERHSRIAKEAQLTDFPVSFVNGHRFVGSVSMTELEMMLGGIAGRQE